MYFSLLTQVTVVNSLNLILSVKFYVLEPGTFIRHELRPLHVGI
jgi:hypothetical protein